MSPQDLLYTVSIILFLDAIVLVLLVYNFSRLGYQFLRFAYAALIAKMVAQIAFFGWAITKSITSLIALGYLAEVAFAVLTLVCLAHMMGRAVPTKLILGCVLFYLGNSLYSMTLGNHPILQWFLAEAGPISLLAIGAYYLLERRESLSTYLLAGVLGLVIVVKLALPVVVDDPYIFSLTFLFGCLLPIVVGVLQLMISSDRMMASLQAKNDELATYKQENRRLELQFTQAQKLESLGVLAGGIAHDFNNMLTSILGYASLAMKKLPANNEVRKDLYMVMSGARQAVDLTSQMLVYAGKGAIEFESIDLSKVLDNMSSLINSIVPPKIRLVRKPVRDLPRLKGDQVQLGQVLMNLVANAVDAIEDAGTIEISTGLAEVDDAPVEKEFFCNRP